MPGALQKRDSFVFLPSTITCCWPFSWVLLIATGYGLCQDRRKEGRRQGKWQELRISRPPAWILSLGKTQDCLGPAGPGMWNNFQLHRKP
jgi:hypothetical protein